MHYQKRNIRIVACNGDGMLTEANITHEVMPSSSLLKRRFFPTLTMFAEDT
jgi:hypothetical protein